MIDASAVAGRLEVVRQRIRAAGGDDERITVIAVTKGFGVDAVDAAAAVGLHDVGENYAQEMLAKAADPAPVDTAEASRWHFIGRLQRNKVRRLGPRVHTWQSVDRLELGEAIARHAPGARVMVQVASIDEEAKGGCPLVSAPDLVGQLADLGLDVRGLMTVGPTDQSIDPRPGFEAVAALAHRLSLLEVSMGMSADIEAAVGAGSTMVRVGTALFGPRRAAPASSGK
ncbi:MAG: YggS family pyridoxal phosphate-dependent enzyme [Acidimicrobiia bacterium]|nr:YggS family pyridoxal phosphate-dependent enzyme [Acidimicrobiia bacterium]